MHEVGDVGLDDVALAVHVKELEDVFDVVLFVAGKLLEAFSEGVDVDEALAGGISLLEEFVEFGGRGEESIDNFGEALEGELVTVWKDTIEDELSWFLGDIDLLDRFLFGLFFDR